MKIGMSQCMVSNTREDREKRSCNHRIKEGRRKIQHLIPHASAWCCWSISQEAVGSLGAGGLLAVVWTDASGTAPAYPGNEPFPWDQSHKKRSGKLDQCLTRVSDQKRPEKCEKPQLEADFGYLTRSGLTPGEEFMRLHFRGGQSFKTASLSGFLPVSSLMPAFWLSITQPPIFSLTCSLTGDISLANAKFMEKNL